MSRIRGASLATVRKPDAALRAQPVRPQGRPRDTDADTAILEAAAALLMEGGVEALTMSGVVARSGVARATAYRRWANRHDLLVAVARGSMGVPPVEVAGDLVDGLYRGADTARQVFAAVSFRRVLPALIDGLLAGPESPDHVEFDTLFPGRATVSAALDAGAAEAGLRSDVESELVIDMILGAALVRLLATGHAPDAVTSRASVDLLLAGLRPRAGEGS